MSDGWSNWSAWKRAWKGENITIPVGCVFCEVQVQSHPIPGGYQITYRTRPTSQEAAAEGEST